MAPSSSANAGFSRNRVSIAGLRQRGIGSPRRFALAQERANFCLWDGSPNPSAHNGTGRETRLPGNTSVDGPLAPVAQPVAQEVVEIRNGIDLLNGGVD